MQSSGVKPPHSFKSRALDLPQFGAPPIRPRGRSASQPVPVIACMCLFTPEVCPWKQQNDMLAAHRCCEKMDE